jgi:HAD superfamily hydrolase (TIGR01549 family)
MEFEEARADRLLGALPRRPRAVLLDGMGTLVALEPPHERLRTGLREAAGIELSGRRAKDAFRAEIDWYLDHHLEGRDEESLDRLRDGAAGVLREALGAPAAGLDRAVVKRVMLDAIEFDAFADAAPALRALRDGGLRLVVASNWDCSLPDVLARAGLLHLVDAVVPSAAAGAAKPDARLFEAALGAAGCGPGDALHVGDSLDNDVAGATAAGIAALLLVRGGDAPPGVPVIRSLVELPAVLGAGGRMLGRE